MTTHRRTAVGGVLLLLLAGLLAPLPAHAKAPNESFRTVTASRGVGEAATTCGQATFDWFGSTHGETTVKEGDAVCVHIMSNSLSQALLRIGLENDTSPANVFAHELIGNLHNDVWVDSPLSFISDDLRDQKLEKYLPALAKLTRLSGPVSTTFEIAAWVLKALIEHHIKDQINNNGACVAFIVDNDGGKMNVDFRLVYNPLHRTDQDDTVVRVWDRNEKEGRRDTFTARPLGMSCTGSGLVELTNTSGNILKQSVQDVLMISDSVATPPPSGGRGPKPRPTTPPPSQPGFGQLTLSPLGGPSGQWFDIASETPCPRKGRGATVTVTVTGPNGLAYDLPGAVPDARGSWSVRAPLYQSIGSGRFTFATGTYTVGAQCQSADGGLGYAPQSVELTSPYFVRANSATAPRLPVTISSGLPCPTSLSPTQILVELFDDNTREILTSAVGPVSLNGSWNAITLTVPVGAPAVIFGGAMCLDVNGLGTFSYASVPISVSQPVAVA